MKVRHHAGFQPLFVEPERNRRRFPFSEDRKQPAGQPAAAVVVDPAIDLVEFRCRRHGAAPNPYCLKTEAAWALTNELLVFGHIYKITRYAFSVKYQKTRLTMTKEEVKFMPAEVSVPPQGAPGGGLRQAKSLPGFAE